MSAKIMADKFPLLASRLLESHPHIAYSDHGSTVGYFKDGDFRVKSKKLEDGSIIQPTGLGRKTLLNLLNKSGYQEVTAQQAVSAFDYAPDNKEWRLPRDEAVKWRIDRLERLSHPKFMDPLNKNPYEFGACRSAI
jgi:hypothetical protein